MVTILGAGGPIGNELATRLSAKETPIRLVARHPKAVPGAETIAADLADPEQTIAAVTGSDVACLLVGLKYDLATWQELWPRIMRNAIDACKRTGTKLLFFDNVYMYGSVAGLMTEATPYRPCSKKGEIRARIATALMDEVRAGNLTAMIARSADFYGPNTKNGVPNVLVFEPFAKRGTASWLVNANVPHSLTFTPDAARGVAMLIERKSAWNQIWHLPTAPDPPTGKAFIQMAATAFGVPARYRMLSKLMLRVAAWFDPLVRESLEMLYQNSAPYLFDSTKFANEFGFAGTPYADAIRIAADSYERTAPIKAPR
jgi:nucleoside-diphosphate-sugar epimerase